MEDTRPRLELVDNIMMEQAPEARSQIDSPGKYKKVESYQIRAVFFKIGILQFRKGLHIHIQVWVLLRS